MTPRRSSPEDATDDPLLRRELRAALAPDAATADALGTRVLAQWRQQAGTSVQGQGDGPVRALAGRHALRPWLIGVTGLACGAALALALWLQRPDPALDELLQLDVLSQMAAGEM